MHIIIKNTYSRRVKKMQSIWGDLFVTRKNKLLSISLKTFVFVLICTSWIFRSSREPSFEFLALPLWCPRACAHSLRMCTCVYVRTVCVCVYVRMCAQFAHSLVSRDSVLLQLFSGVSFVSCIVPLSHFPPSRSLTRTHTHSLSPLPLSFTHATFKLFPLFFSSSLCSANLSFCIGSTWAKICVGHYFEMTETCVQLQIFQHDVLRHQAA